MYEVELKASEILVASLALEDFKKKEEASGIDKRIADIVRKKLIESFLNAERASN